MGKGGGSGKPYLVELSSEQRALLRSLISGRGRPAGPAARGGAAKQAAKAREREAIILSAEEMALLRRLSGLTPQPPKPKRTADLDVSAGELKLLRRMAEPAPPEAARARRRTTDIVVSPEEIRFLRALSGKDVEAPPEQLRMLHRKLSAEGPAEDAPLLLSLTPPEAEWLNTITRDGYSFITPGERRARLILREKLHAAMERAPSDGGRSDRPPEGEPKR